MANLNSRFPHIAPNLPNFIILRDWFIPIFQMLKFTSQTIFYIFFLRLMSQHIITNRFRKEESQIYFNFIF